MAEQCCMECTYYEHRYCECTCGSMPQGDIEKDPMDGKDCPFFWDFDNE